jgi:FtsZ-interacting cell division protein YlmF
MIWTRKVPQLSNSIMTPSRPMGIIAKVLEYFGFYATSQKIAQVDMASKVANITPVRPIRKRTAGMDNITTLIPSSYLEATMVSNSIQDGVPVILNLGIMKKEEALRMIDYCLGVTHMANGSIKRITESVFIVAPYGVSIEGENDEPQMKEPTAEMPVVSESQIREYSMSA